MIERYIAANCHVPYGDCARCDATLSPYPLAMGARGCCPRPRCCHCGCPPPPCPPCPPNPPCQTYYALAFETNGGVPVPLPQTVVQGDRAVRPADPVREGYTFEGWYQSPDFTGYAWDFDVNVVMGNMVLYAQWVPVTFMVTFDANGGAPVPVPELVPYGGLVARPADPVRAGYTFLGWYTTIGLSEAWDFNTDVVTGNMVLYARWELATFMVSFDTNGGMPVPASQIVSYGGLVSRPTDPIREDYVFVAWYPTPTLTGLPWTFPINTVTGNMTLYARWLQPV